MDADFWHRRWQKNEIGWHENAGNAHLIEHFKALSLAPASRVFVPLCGKTLDIAWLLGQGCHVLAIELSEMAVQQLFKQLDVEPALSEMGSLKCYSAPNLDVFVGDFFTLTAEQLGAIDAVFDRASLVAMPEQLRQHYTEHLMRVTANAKQLLIVFEYDQSEMPGPPFSISSNEIDRRYGDLFSISPLGSIDVTGYLRGDFKAEENAYLLQSQAV